MYIVRFNRLDGEIEDYYYWTEAEAKQHKAYFDDDDSGLYESIEILEER